MLSLTTRRLTSTDVAVFRAIRSEGLVDDAASFRISVMDDDSVSLEGWRLRLERDFVVAVETEGRILGIGGFARIAGTKTEHKGLIWGMYVRPAARGTGAADHIMTTLLAHAATTVWQVQLTVVAANRRAVRFYERHGFESYGIEPSSIRMDDGSFIDEALMWRRV